MCTDSQREKKKRKKKPAKKSKISPEGTDVAALRKSLLLIKKDETWKRSEIRFRSQINSLFRIYLKTTLFERNEKNVFSRRWPAKTHENTRRGKSCSVVSPTVLNHHRHHHHHLTRRGGREREEAIRWRDKKRERERSSCVFVLRLCARSLLSRLSPIISRCCNSAEEAQHRGNEDTESFGNS